MFFNNFSGAERKQLHKTDKKVGIDVGLKEFSITCDGEFLCNPKWLKSEKRLKKIQKDLLRKKKVVTIEKKVRIKLVKIHEKICFRNVLIELR
ncbi:MAG: transposase [Vallitalea sp.]|jgi:putative transposase|nr:transposase [Vallitalea sp.]